MSLGKLAAVILAAATFGLASSFAGQLSQPSSAGAADNSAAVLATLKRIDVKLRATNGQLVTANGKLISIDKGISSLSTEVGATPSGAGLRGETKTDLSDICLAINNLSGSPNDPTNPPCP
jgi:hypothetical protein